MDADFWEVGASGRVFSRDFVLEALRKRYAAGEPDHWATEDFGCRELGPDTYLVTYLLHQGAESTRRATIWRRAPAGRRTLYHQGTLIA